MGGFLGLFYIVFYYVLLPFSWSDDYNMRPYILYLFISDRTF